MILSIKTFKPFGTLGYHERIQAIVFARNTPPPSHPTQNQSRRGGVWYRWRLVRLGRGGGGTGGCDEEFGGSEIEARRQWLVAGGEDGPVSVRDFVGLTKPKP